MKFLFWLGLALPLIVACSTTRNSTIREPSGAGLALEDYGYLRVYSVTEVVSTESGDYEPHTPFTLFSEDGTFVDTITNRVSNTNEEPVRVKLPVGSYLVGAKSATAGWINVPVRVEKYMASSIYIDGSWKLPDELETKTKLIRLPNGDVVGWYGELIKEY